MKPLLLVHGPNLNRLGVRDQRHYGHLTLSDIESLTAQAAEKLGLSLLTSQSNHEGILIDTLQSKTNECSGIIINPGALAHYSYALHDALVDTGLPAVEVHLSEISQREAWRKHSVTASACIRVVSGKKEKGYIEAVQVLWDCLNHGN